MLQNGSNRKPEAAIFESLYEIYKTRRKLIKLILSVSVFSLFFSHSYWLSLLHSFTFNFHNTLPFQLFSHNIDKNCIFLLCNGLLVFVAKYSGLISSSSSKYNLSHDDQSFKSYEDVPIVLETKLAPLVELEVALETDIEAVKNSIVMEERKQEEAEIETESFTMEEEEEEEEDGEKCGLREEEEENADFVGEDEAELKDFEETENYDREEEYRLLSTEELNKKFDEFIRKMKEEIRIEARY